MLAAIESAQGINNAVEIAFSSRRLIGIALGAASSAASMTAMA
ncbi:aldolase/citrate lyase family protein [Vibrio cholerae]